MFLAILYSINGRHVSNHQNSASYIYIYIYVCVSVYLPVKVDTNVLETVDIL